MKWRLDWLHFKMCKFIYLSVCLCLRALGFLLYNSIAYCPGTESLTEPENRTAVSKPQQSSCLNYSKVHVATPSFFQRF